MTFGRRKLSNIKRLEDEVSQVALGHAVKAEVIPSLLDMLISTNDLSGKMNTAETTPSSAKSSARSRPIHLKTQSGLKTANSTKDVTEFDATEFCAPKKVVVSSPHWVEPDVFADLVLADDEDIAPERVRLIQADGVPDEEILLELLAPTSVELGERWENDTCDFADVTIGVCRLHRIVRSLHPQHRRELVSSAHGGRVVLAPAPNDQHSFGLLLVGELLFRHGWYTDIEINDRSQHIINMVNQNWYEIAGISISCEARIADAAAFIAEIRLTSCNPDIAILVGGPVFASNPDAGETLDADKIALPGANIATLATPYIPTPSRA